ncbi:MAG: hypothetical protein ABI364_04330 [Caldimonas sp.]
MSRRTERRKSRPEPEEALSPEYLAVLEVCGGEIRAGDRALLEERRHGEPGAPEILPPAAPFRS